ncbi:MAG: single-stranded DNA-binding protein [Promethearchaeota archaeon]
MPNASTQKLENLQPFQRGITIHFQVIKTEAVRKVKSRHDDSNHRVADILIGDETGLMRLTLWDDEISQVEDGKAFRLVNGQSGLFQGHIQVSLGRNGKLELSEHTIPEVNTKRNLSAKTHPASTRSKGHKKSNTRREVPVRRSRGFKWSRIDRKSD